MVKNIYFYNAHGEKSSMFRDFEFDEYETGFARIVDSDGDIFQAKKIKRSWYLHNDGDIATMSTDMDGNPYYLFYHNGRNCRIEDLPCDGETNPNNGFYWYE